MYTLYMYTLFMKMIYAYRHSICTLHMYIIYILYIYIYKIYHVI